MRLSECVQTACVLLFLEWIGEEKTKPTSCKSITLSNRHKILDIFLSFTNKKDNIQDNCWPDIEPSLQMFLHILGFIVANLQRRCLRMTSALLEKLSGNHHLKNSELYHMQCESLYVAKLRSPWWCLSTWIIIRSNCLIENSDRLPLTVRVHTCNLCIFWGVGHCKEFPATTLVEGPVNKSDSLRQALRPKNNNWFPFTVLADCVVEKHFILCIKSYCFIFLLCWCI